MRDPLIDPMPGDVIHKWGQHFAMTQVTQGCIFTMPSLSAYRDWVGLPYYREFATDAEVFHVDAVCAPEPPAQKEPPNGNR